MEETNTTIDQFISHNKDLIFSNTPKNPMVKQEDEWRTEGSEKKYFEVRDRYLAEALSI